MMLIVNKITMKGSLMKTRLLIMFKTLVKIQMKMSILPALIIVVQAVSRRIRKASI